MVKAVIASLPDDLELFFQELRSSACSENWNWKRLYTIFASGNRHANAFSAISEAGVYHLLYSKSINKDSTVKCNQMHICNLSTLQLSGSCFSSLLFTGLAAKRADKFRDLLLQSSTSLVDSLICALELSDFPYSTLQPLKDLQNQKTRSLSRLIAVERKTLGVKNALAISINRIDFLSSVLRTVFTNGSFTELPVCVPYICSLMSSTLSVNLCDALHTSPALISCVRRLLHCFAIIITSCGVHISPAAPVITTSLVYQLEWSSHFANSSPSDSSLTYRLAVYRCLSSLIEASRQTCSVVLVRLLPRIVKDICSDFVNDNSIVMSQSSLPFDDNTRIIELKMCCAVAASRIVEQIFVHHSFALKSVLCGCVSQNDDENASYKLKRSIIALHNELDATASCITRLHKQSYQINNHQRLVLTPHLLIPLLNSLSSMVEYGYLSVNVCSFRELARLNLNSEDPVLRNCAERCLRHAFRYTEKCLVTTNTNDEKLRSESSVFSSVSTQSESLSSTEVSTQVESMGPVALSQPETPPEPAATVANSSAPPLENLSSPKPLQKRVRFEDDPTPSKKFCEDPVTMKLQSAPSARINPSSTSGHEMEGETGANLTSVQDLLCAFDDTLL